jgi:hypothetical protein
MGVVSLLGLNGPMSVEHPLPKQVFEAAVGLVDTDTKDLLHFEPLRTRLEDPATRRKRALHTAEQALAAIWNVPSPKVR